ncbi:MAG: TRAP transporter large permease [Fusobacteriaceae bacterium]|jgi:tripartite ATP-independent transporter DctM subunit|nr:TRAP transporter large permease [Fusobacteriaceae bacterium]
MLALVVCVLLIGLMILGAPVCVVMGATAAGVFYYLGQGSIMAVMAQKIYTGTTGFTLLAIPFFILAGNLMNTGGITDRIFRFAKAICGHWPGGLGQVNILSSLIFSGMSGAAVADAAGLGVIEMKAMDDAGFDHKFSAGITAASSTIGPVVPPSIPFVVYSSAVGTVSVFRLFMAGFVPGFMMAGAMALAVYVISKKKKFPMEPKMPWGLRLKYFLEAIPSLMTVVIILAGIWIGFFTATEAAVVASFYALLLGTVIYREITLKGLVNIIYDSLIQSCKTLFIIAIANFLGYFLMHQRIPNKIITSLLSVTSNNVVLILLIIFVLILLGCFIEGTAIILICTPIFLPIVNQVGMDLTQFGVVMVLSSMIGLLTPPVGMSLYAVCSITGVSLVDLSKEVLPYVAGIFIVLLLCAFWQPFSTFLPRLILGS